MTYLVLSENNKVLQRLDIRTTIKDGVYVNQRAEQKAEKYWPIEPQVEFNSPLRNEDVVITNPGTHHQDSLPQEKVESPEPQHEHNTPQPDNRKQNINQINSFWEVHNATEGTTPRVTIEGASHWEHEHKREVDAGTLRGKTFFSKPDIEGDQYWATVDNVQPTEEFTADQREALIVKYYGKAVKVFGILFYFWKRKKHPKILIELTDKSVTLCCLV
jgi:hypothetical protein